MKIKEAFIILQEQLALTQYPGRVFRFGIPAAPIAYDVRDNEPPGLFLDWWKGRLDWKFMMCMTSQLEKGTADFNALIVLTEQYLSPAVKAQYPGLIDNEILALHMAELADTLIAKVIAINSSNVGFFAAPMLPTHSLTKDETASAVNLMIRVSGLSGWGE